MDKCLRRRLELARRERILDHVMPEVNLRRIEASLIDFRVLDIGDDEVPGHIVYSAVGTTRVAWADPLH